MNKSNARQRPSHTRPKYSVQKATQDFTSKIRVVVGRIACDRHNAPIGEPCWDVVGDTTKYFGLAICNQRASKIYTGKPTDRASMNNREYKRLQKEKTG